MRLLKTYSSHLDEIESGIKIEEKLLFTENKSDFIKRDLILELFDNLSYKNGYLIKQKGIDIEEENLTQCFIIDNYKLYDNNGVWEIYVDVYILESVSLVYRILSEYLKEGYNFDLDINLREGVISTKDDWSGTNGHGFIQLPVEEWEYYIRIDSVFISNDNIFQIIKVNDRNNKIKKVLGEDEIV